MESDGVGILFWQYGRLQVWAGPGRHGHLGAKMVGPVDSWTQIFLGLQGGWAAGRFLLTACWGMSDVEIVIFSIDAS